jgi:hypothetical protein
MILRTLPFIIIIGSVRRQSIGAMAPLGSRLCDERRFPLVLKVLMTFGGSCVNSPPKVQRRREARKPQPVRPCVAPLTRTATE